MSKIALYVTVVTLTVFLFASGMAIAQMTKSSESIDIAPIAPPADFITDPENPGDLVRDPGVVEPFGQIVPPTAFPEPFLVPEKDVNNFELSTLDRSTLTGGEERRSNLEVNLSEVVKKKEVQPGDFPFDLKAPERDSYSLSSLGTTDKYYTWVDENGVMHITNSLDSVPGEYRDRLESESY